MKKQLVSILTAGCLMAAMVPAAFAADATMSEEALKSAVAKGGTVDLTGDVTLNSTLEIKDGVIIDGNGYTITYTPNTQTYAIDIQTNDAVKFQDITIDAPAGNMTNGIVVQNCVPHLTLDNTELNVMRFGISFTPTGADSTLDVVNNSAILNRRVNDYATEAVQGDCRGITFWDSTNAIVNITNSDIKGFGYSINIAGSSVQGNDTNMKMNVSNSDIWGWSAFNVWTIGNEFNIKNSDLRGINTSTGGANNFGTIVLNRDIYGSSNASNKFTITGGSIGAYQFGDRLEFPIRIDDELKTRFDFKKLGMNGPVKFISNVKQAAFTFTTPNLSDETMQAYLNDYVTGAENCDLSGLNPQNVFFSVTQ